MVVVPGVTAPGRPQYPRAVVVDRQPLFLAALRNLLAAPPLNAEVTVTTKSREALQMVEREHVDFLVCELPTDDEASPQALARCCRVILLADREDESLLVDALSSGAAGFFTKDTSLEEFLEGVQAVIRGNFTVSRQLLLETMGRLSGQGDGARDRTPRDELKRLSPTELVILTMLGHADSVRVIAERRQISQKTVRNHLASIYRKIGVRNRSEAILWTVRIGLTHPGL